MKSLAAIALWLILSSTANAHGFLKYVDHKGVAYGLWQLFSDPYYSPLPLRYDRTILDNGPVVGMTGPNITCNNGGNNPLDVGTIEVAAGDTLRLVWDQWGSSHSGPVMTYMAKCTPNCASFKGDTGSPWFKIDQFAYDASKTPPWGSDYLARQGAWWKVTIPPTLSAGEYLLRHEILGLHVASTVNGAQFYPSCVHLKVTGGGGANPNGVALPGAYNPNDTGGRCYNREPIYHTDDYTSYHKDHNTRHYEPYDDNFDTDKHHYEQAGH
ncbi:Endoglucanase-4 [Drechslerella dactyloides]|uniref:lytic cellulose monooxygenase (C4-dehydrogenating) n=1 Tax=Drechslerella dactyloides TaxID=74499 RepID=A0AAD6IVC0_DREDA|nr:Endoglucanase-4 [Drechslerella dactyloides]